MPKNMHDLLKDLSRKNEIVNRFAVFMDSRDIQCTQRVHEGDRLEFKLYRVDQEFGAYEITLSLFGLASSLWSSVAR